MSAQENLASASRASAARHDGVEHARKEAAAALARLRQARVQDDGPCFLRVAAAIDDLPALEREAEALRARFRHLVVIGTGGSSLGAQAIAGALAPGRTNGRHSLSFLDNVDPAAVTRALDALDLETTCFLAVSKSGTTAETLALSFAVLDRLSKGRATEHLRFIIEPGDSPMRRLAARLGASVFDHDPNLGGRFSVLSLVGLLPALFLGLDARALRAGAAEAMAHAFDSSAELPPPAEAAALLIGKAPAHGIGTHVLMTYGDALEPFGLWWRQLVGESLGKDGKGITPITSRGTADQHSQLQLYLAGPPDKFFTVLSVAAPAVEPRFGRGLADALGISYLGGQSLGSLFAAEAEATARSLAEHGRPLRRLVLQSIDARTLGSLFMQFMLETVVTAELLGVNAFDQPAVEHGKRLVVEMLSGAKP